MLEQYVAKKFIHALYLFTCIHGDCIFSLQFLIHHIHGIQDKHLRVDAEGHCHSCVAHWDDGRGWLTQGMSLLKELWLVLMIYVRTMASAHIITVVRSL